MTNKKGLHRTFICVDFPDPVIEEVARVQEVLGKWKFIGKMTELDNLHLTLKFLGEIDSEKLEKVRERLGKINFLNMNLRLGDVGLFNYMSNPRIVWIKIEGRGIFELQKKIDEALEGLFKKEERFMSHVTVARVKYVKDKKGFSDYVKRIKLKDVGFEIGKFKLNESELNKIGPFYKTVEEFSFR